MTHSLPIINGYALTQEFTNKNAGTCMWSFCTKGGREYFIKQFLSPKYPLDSAEISESQKEKKRRIADSFFAERNSFYRILEKCDTGNNIIIRDFFRYGSVYYAVSEKISTESLPISDISTLSETKKLLILRVILNNIKSLHKNGVVHADIKPDNIIVKATHAGFYTAKIIDFESSYLESAPPECPTGDQIYFAPETLAKINGAEEGEESDVPLTSKVDIFALGVLFHEYWTGERPKINTDEYNYVHEAVLDGAEVTLSELIPEYIRSILSRMLDKDPDKRPTAAQLFDELCTWETPVSDSDRSGDTASSEDVPGREAPAEEVIAEETAAEEESAEEVPAAESPAEEVIAEDAAAEEPFSEASSTKVLTDGTEPPKWPAEAQKTSVLYGRIKTKMTIK